MDLLLKKREIIEEISKTDDEKLVWAIARLLHLDEDMDVPEWHKQILEERSEKYITGNASTENWDDVQKNL